MKDYYAVFQVSPQATPAEIQKAYRELVRQTHPDTASGGDPRRFLEVQEAWEHLGCPERRRAYDTQRVRKIAIQQPAFKPAAYANDAGGARPAAPLDEPPGGGWFGRRPDLDLLLSAAEAAYGAEIPLALNVLGRCRSCGGRGRHASFVCWACHGRGAVPARLQIVLRTPPGLRGAVTTEVPLDRYGLPGESVLVRIRTAA